MRDWEETTFVLKLGGEILTLPDRLEGILRDAVALKRAGIRVVLVHGGGPQADRLAKDLGHEVCKVNGRRITTDRDLDIAKYLYGGALNLELISALARCGERGIRVSGLDGGLVLAQRRPPLRSSEDGTVIDFGHVGDILSVDPAILTLLLSNGYVPVVAPLAGDRAGAIFNVNADTVASAVAQALGAAKLILLTNVPGILDHAGQVLPSLDSRLAARLISEGAIRGGMIPKVQNALSALEGGVPSVHVLDGMAPESLLLKLLTPEPVGTLLTAEEESHG
jgi:acetylglutamate kinase